MTAEPFNPDAPTQEYPALVPVKEVRQVIHYEDLGGFRHTKYVDAYKASIKAQLIKLLRPLKHNDFSVSDVADNFMREFEIKFP